MLRDVLAVTGGHRVDLEAFLSLVEAACAEHGARWAHAVHPGARRWLRPGSVDRWDAVLLHDITGLHLRRGEPPAPYGPDPAEAADLRAVLAQGQGFVVLHHALASWPAWDEWASAVGGRFFYAPGDLRGERWPSSGTRLATYTARPVDQGHPVCRGVDVMTLTDELYLCPVFEDEVVPLVRADIDPDPALFVSTYEHVIGGVDAAPDCAGHPAGSDLVAWASSAGPSPIVSIQPGDSPTTFAEPAYRHLVANALAWVASPEARAWAEGRA